MGTISIAAPPLDTGCIIEAGAGKVKESEQARHAILFLAGEAAGVIIGAALAVDDGITAG